ncbi:tRNA-splicing endonuclease subunit [Rhynchospora pubera]|uniref:tRNA-splicing endonuclease subunit n=1 Tax=Rhynchospora pubera TaxID=906938 RepID=A0AAV8ELC9_9POAL|nr:tRNA-splicing endonuclease subunit [Rhynchospora pubera]
MDGEEVSKVEGETRRQRKGRERGENQERSRQRNSFLLEDDTEEIHFNPFLPSSPSSNNSPLSGSQIRTEVSKARWVEEIGMAQVIEKKGSLWVSTGVIRNSKLYCHIEEIGYLAQIGALVLFDEGDNVMGLQDIFTKCADRQYGCSWESFEAYRHLKSLGYIVGRQGQPWSLKHNKINRNSDSTADTDLIAGRIEELQIGAANLVFDIHQPNSKFKKTDPGNPSFIICLVGDRPPSRKEVEDLEKKCKSVPLKFCHVSHDNVSFFSFPKVSLPVLP